MFISFIRSIGFRRLLALPVCLLTLAAFSDDAQRELAAACADSLLKRQERGRDTPAALVANREPVCRCVAGAVAGDGGIPAADKPKVTGIFALIASGDMDGARALRRALDAPINDAMRRITRDCARGHADPLK